MTGVWWTGEGAAAEGAAITPGLSATQGGYALQQSLGAGNTQKLTAAAAIFGSFGIEHERTTGSVTAYLFKAFAGVTHMANTYYWTCPAALPTGNWGMQRWRNSANTNLCSMYYTTAGKVQMQTAGGTNMWTSTFTPVAGTKYRIETYIEPTSTPGTTGKVKIKWFVWNSDTLLETEFVTTTTNLGTTGDIGYWQWGRFDTGGGVGVMRQDMPGYDIDIVDAYLGKYGVLPPTQVAEEGPSPVWPINLGTSLNSNGGALSHGAPTHVSGPVLSWTEPVDGLFLFVQDDTAASVYAFTTSEAGSGSVVVNRTIPVLVAGSNEIFSPKRWDPAAASGPLLKWV